MAVDFTPDADWLSPHPSPSVPTRPLPAGAVDAHCHVFGPGHIFPYAPERKYTPSDAGAAALFALRDLLGVSLNVIVQATCHGSDNRALVNALDLAKDRARGVAVVDPDVSDAELRTLHDAGVRGVRFNFVRRLANPRPDADYIALAERVAELGWHIVVYFEASDLHDRWTLLTSLPTTVVVDHMGRPDIGAAAGSESFGEFVRLLEENENIWTKVTCPERLSRLGPPRYDDVVPFARELTTRFPDRVIWGTDWPHPNMKSHMPDDGLLVDFMERVVIDDDARTKLLVTNPTRLYWGQSDE